MIEFQDVRIVLEDVQRVQQQVTEIAGVERAQTGLVDLVETLSASFGEGPFVVLAQLVRHQAAILPAIDQAGEMARRPALLVDILGLDDLFEQAQLVVRVKNGERGFQIHQFGMAAQDLGRDRVKGSQPGHALDGFADDLADALLHLACRLVGEGDGEDFPRPGTTGREDVGEAGGEDAGLAGAGTGQHQDRSVHRFHCRTLLIIQPVQIGRRRRRARHVGDGKTGHAIPCCLGGGDNPCLSNRFNLS